MSASCWAPATPLAFGQFARHLQFGSGHARVSPELFPGCSEWPHCPAHLWYAPKGTLCWVAGPRDNPSPKQIQSAVASVPSPQPQMPLET